jgi:hypothetical protein
MLGLPSIYLFILSRPNGCTGDMINAYKILVGIPKAKRPQINLTKLLKLIKRSLTVNQDTLQRRFSMSREPLVIRSSAWQGDGLQRGSTNESEFNKYAVADSWKREVDQFLGLGMAIQSLAIKHVVANRITVDGIRRLEQGAEISNKQIHSIFSWANLMRRVNLEDRGKYPFSEATSTNLNNQSNSVLCLFYVGTCGTPCIGTDRVRL